MEIFNVIKMSDLNIIQNIIEAYDNDYLEYFEEVNLFQEDYEYLLDCEKKPKIYIVKIKDDIMYISDSYNLPEFEMLKKRKYRFKPIDISRCISTMFKFEISGEILIIELNNDYIIFYYCFALQMVENTKETSYSKMVESYNLTLIDCE